MYISIMYYYIVVHSFFLLIGLDTEYLKSLRFFRYLCPSEKYKIVFCFVFGSPNKELYLKLKQYNFSQCCIFIFRDKQRESKCLFLGQQNTSISPMVISKFLLLKSGNLPILFICSKD